MRNSVKIKSWLSIEKMFQWTQNSSDEWSYKRRMAIWLTYTGNLSANKISEILGVSTQAVWLWIRQYNTKGPEGLKRKGRGGRRWGFLTIKEENQLLKPFIKKIKTDDFAAVSSIKQAVEKKLGKKVSKPYIYRLLSRHKWTETIAQSKTFESEKQLDNFQKFSQPWKTL